MLILCYQKTNSLIFINLISQIENIKNKTGLEA